MASFHWVVCVGVGVGCLVVGLGNCAVQVVTLAGGARAAWWYGRRWWGLGSGDDWGVWCGVVKLEFGFGYVVICGVAVRVDADAWWFGVVWWGSWCWGL